MTHEAGRPDFHGDAGAVSSSHWLATGVAQSVLSRGGNAADAAAAAGLALQVIEPHLNGPAGEVSLLVARRDAAPVAISGQGRAPAAATAGLFRDLGLTAIPGNGLLAACVPGAFDAWMVLLLRYGTWSLGEILGYSIALAADGIPVQEPLHRAIAEVEELFREDWTGSAELYLPGGSAPAPGTRLRNPALARTWRRILAEAQTVPGRDRQIERARACFYRGFVAEEIERFASRSPTLDLTGRRHRGLLTAQDMSRHESPVEETCSFDYHGTTVHKVRPWSQGPVFLQQLAVLDGVDLAGMGHQSADYLHTIVEASKLAFADREAWYGDPDFVDVPLDGLLSPEYNRRRRALLGERASTELRPGTVDGRPPRLARPLGLLAEPRGPHRTREPTIALPTGPVDGDTCHLSVVDRYGTMISMTPSGGWLQSSPTIPGLGFALGTRAQMFWLEQGLANSLAPGKRPRTTLSPSIAVRDGAPYLAWGTPGGDGQDQWTLALFLAQHHFGPGLAAAIDAPAFTSLHAPESFYPRRAHPGRVVVGAALDPSVRTELARRGHEVVDADPRSLGRLCAVGADPAPGFYRAAADTRGGQCLAVAW